MNSKVQEVIKRIKGKGGESYDGNGRHGWRNPIKDDTGNILHAIVLAAKPRRILEIGTAYGLSGMYLASALENGCLMDTIEFFKPVADEAQRNFDEADLPVSVLCGDADELLEKINGVYDFVFLDAEKKMYYHQFLQLMKYTLVSHGAIIVADNVIDRRSEMEDFLACMETYPSTIINTKCGLLVARIP